MIKDQGQMKSVWDSRQNDIMMEALTAKFHQSEHCSNFFKSTRKTRLAEVNPSDKYWRVGLHLRDRNIWNFKNWKGQNKLGEMLMEICDSM